MNLTITDHVVRTVVVATNDRVDAFNAPQLRERVNAILFDGVNRLVIDLSGIPFLDSAGMAALVSALKHARQQGGDVKLVWPREEAARRILRLTRFNRVFDLTETANEAIARFEH